jgi:hypothetical protein
MTLVGAMLIAYASALPWIIPQVVEYVKTLKKKSRKKGA